MAGDILGYARVSTNRQDLAIQELRLESSGCIRVFGDIVSGVNFRDRDGLKELKKQLRVGDTLCVVRLDRLGRSLKELLEITEDLKDRGVHLKSLEEDIDTNSPTGELVLQIFASIAQFERKLISERTRDGLSAVIAQGKKLGRPRIDSNVLASALNLVDAGQSPTVVSQQLSVSRSRIYEELAKRRHQ